MNSFKLNCMSGAAAIAIALFAASGAQAALVPVNFTVTSSSTLPLSQDFQNAVKAQFSGSVVDRISGQFQYDPGTVGRTGQTKNYFTGSYGLAGLFNIGFFSGSQLLFGSTTAPDSTSAIDVAESRKPDISSEVNVILNGGTFTSPLFTTAGVSYALDQIVVNFEDASRTVITSRALPTESIWEGLPATLSIGFTVNGIQQAVQSATISSIQVPEPAPLALMATGLLALGFAVRRNRNS